MLPVSCISVVYRPVYRYIPYFQEEGNLNWSKNEEQIGTDIKIRAEIDDVN